MPRVKAPKPPRKYKYAIQRACGAPPLPILSNVDSRVLKSPNPVPVPRRPIPEEKVQPAAPRFAFTSLISGIENNTDTKIASKKTKVGPSNSNNSTKATKSPSARPAKEATAKIAKRKLVVETKPVTKTKPVVETNKSAKTTTSKRKANDISRDDSPTTTAKEKHVKALAKGTKKRSLSPEVVHAHDNPTPPPSKKVCTHAETPVRETSATNFNTKTIKPRPKPSGPLSTTIGTKPTVMLSPPRSSIEPQPTMTPKIRKCSSRTHEHKALLPEITSKINTSSKALEHAPPTYRESFLGPLAMRYGTSMRDEMGPKWAIVLEGKTESRYWENISGVSVLSSVYSLQLQAPAFRNIFR
ncbi:hypothetical protein DFP73DRAFT_589702 [Morchella snyderi]|nr:hypothetical protein DFP73DRAFT_589702 [Morchella snyderi]